MHSFFHAMVLSAIFSVVVAVERCKCTGTCKIIGVAKHEPCGSKRKCEAGLVCVNGKCTVSKPKIAPNGACTKDSNCHIGFYCGGCNRKGPKYQCKPRPSYPTMGPGGGCHPKYANFCQCGLSCRPTLRTGAVGRVVYKCRK